jgi:hypothetical protein
MYYIRRAEPDEYQILTDIAFNSEAYWGYDSEYMDKFKCFYSVSKEFIKNNPTFLIEQAGAVIGFYGLLIEEKETALEYFLSTPNT